MNNIIRDARSKYSTYGNSKAIIEILNIGFEPLLTDEEYIIYQEIGDLVHKINSIRYSIGFIESKLLYLSKNEVYYQWLSENSNKLNELYNSYSQDKKNKSDLFRQVIQKNINITRKIYDDRQFKKEEQFRNIAIFESDLTRKFQCKDMEHSDDIISIVTYYTEIFNSIVNNGFDYKGKHFIFFTAGAGQTRCKKSTFVSEDKLNETFNSLFCGLSREKINELGGMNTNKFLAYTSLCQTNSEIWFGFNIDKAIVVEDIEYEIPNQEVRHVYTETPEDKMLLQDLQSKIKNITNELKTIKENKKNNPKGYRREKSEVQHEKSLINNKKELQLKIDELKLKYHKTTITKMPVTIPFTDGFGISLKKIQSSMIRLPFIKGLIAYCPRRVFQDWCSEHNYTIHKIKDIYGKEHSINNVDYIFTKSQFKMWKYYNNQFDNNDNISKTGWELYKEYFKQFNCDACRCNIETYVKLNSKTNYQILQTLTTEMSDDDISKLADYDINSLNGIGKNIQCMLNVLGANENKNNNMNWLQKSLIIYPEMFKDFYVKSLLKNTKNSMVNKFRSGKFNINGAYTFAIPDTLACLQWWFTDMDKTKLEYFGFVKKDHVVCNLFKNKEKLDCLRSPHLDHSHCIRKNYINDDIKKWIKSQGVYIGMTDTMSKLLMYDNDGDKLLIHNNKTIIKCAEDFQNKYGMIPNYYEMPKANPQMITNESLFEGIVMAYHHGNIGTPSNEITKVWAMLNPNSTQEEIEKAIEVIALRCVDVNFTIDYAKTLYKPTIPKHILNNYKIYSGNKVPHFFIYAKGKRNNQVEPQGLGNIDRISDVVKNNRIIFKDLLGKYSYKILMHNDNIDITTDKAQKIIELYREIENVNIRKMAHMNFSVLDFDEKKKARLQLEFDSRKQKIIFLDIINESEEYITDVLIKGLQSDINKDTLWRLFGEVIYNNLERNLNGTKICKNCGERFEYKNGVGKPKDYCVKCAREKELEMTRKRMNKMRNKL